MKARLLLNLGLAALVIALALLVWLKPSPSALPEYHLTTLTARHVRSILIEKPGQAPIALQETPSGWRLTQPYAARADGPAVERLLEILATTSSQRFPAADLVRFQLDTPLLRLTLNDQLFLFGTQNPLTGEIYVASGDQVLLLAPRHLANALRTPADFTDRTFLAEQEKPTGFDFVDLKLSLLNNGKWSTVPVRQELEADQLNRWLDEWRHASALVVQPHDGSPPLESFSLRLQDGRSIACKVLKREPELVLLREDEKLQYHFPPTVGQRLLRPEK